jgi:D-glycero-alpha-D-manno-heptose-7-phosphate kinase
LEIQHNADLPAQSGLGSSSAFTVGLLNALYALVGRMISKSQLTLDAIHVEQDLVKENVGSQDQTASVYGGFNKITFNGHHNIVVNPITVNADSITLLQKHLMLFYTGMPRVASKMAAEWIKNTPDKQRELLIMVEMVDEAIHILNTNVMDFGLLLHESWKIKRSLTKNISNRHIDDIFDTALRNGAVGGKILGAGGGGFALFFVEPHLQQGVKSALKLLHVPFSFENTGSQIIYYNPEENY